MRVCCNRIPKKQEQTREVLLLVYFAITGPLEKNQICGAFQGLLGGLDRDEMIA